MNSSQHFRLQPHFLMISISLVNFEPSLQASRTERFLDLIALQQFAPQEPTHCASFNFLVDRQLFS